jgi:hypothetical protein
MISTHPRRIIPDLSHEHDLVLACARVNMTLAARERILRLTSGPLDWSRILSIATLHRVRPLLYKHLKTLERVNTVPAKVWESIQRHANHTIRRNFALTNELARILKIFREAGIPAIPFKGPILGLRAYGNIGLRPFADLDLLLRRADILKAKKILNGLGFASPWKQNDEWEAQHIETQLGCDFTSANGLVTLELHWSFIQKWLSYAVDPEEIWARSQPLDLLGEPTRIVSIADLLPFLCAHGAKHHWERLFWIVDIAEVVGSEKGEDWQNIMKQTAHSGSWRVLALGLYLAQNLLEAPVPPDVATAINSDPGVAKLARQVGSWLFHEENRLQSGSWGETKFYMLCKENWMDRAAYAKHLARVNLSPSDKDRAFVKLPRPLHFLYPAIRPVRWLAQR